MKQKEYVSMELMITLYQEDVIVTSAPNDFENLWEGGEGVGDDIFGD